jgi:deazaflavin-dependent oxidoreductase (nitroreductase family)
VNQALLDRIRRINKRFTNKILIHIAGRQFGHFAILEHVGRKSGKRYRIPIIAEPLENGFVIALTYGKKVDWYGNILASGGCALRWKQRDYTLANPRFVAPETGLGAFPKILRPILRRKGIQYYLQLDILGQTPPQAVQ